MGLSISRRDLKNVRKISGNGNRIDKLIANDILVQSVGLLHCLIRRRLGKTMTTLDIGGGGESQRVISKIVSLSINECAYNHFTAILMYLLICIFHVGKRQMLENMRSN